MKKNIIIVVVVLVLMLTPIIFKDVFLNTDKKTGVNNNDNIDIDTSEKKIKDSLKSVISKYGRDTAEMVEKIYRLETAHFKSTQFKGTGTAGMHAFTDYFPFGWGNELINFVKNYPQAENGFFIKKYTESGTGKTQKYLGFKDIKNAFLFLAYVIKKRGNPASWHTFDPVKQEKYMSVINQVTPKFVNEL